MSDRVRERLRPAHSPDELARIYPKPHDHTRWNDHVARVATTITFARSTMGPIHGDAADLSCGDGAVLAGLDVEGHRYCGDFAPGYPITGPVEQTIEQIPQVDLFVCCETLEHLDDPDAVLKAIRAKSRFMLLSTPVGAWRDTNPEHYWAWSEVGVDEMLKAAGFTGHSYMYLDFRGADGAYAYGVWVVR